MEVYVFVKKTIYFSLKSASIKKSFYFYRLKHCTMHNVNAIYFYYFYFGRQDTWGGCVHNWLKIKNCENPAHTRRDFFLQKKSSIEKSKDTHTRHRRVEPSFGSPCLFPSRKHCAFAMRKFPRFIQSPGNRRSFFCYRCNGEYTGGKSALQLYPSPAIGNENFRRIQNAHQSSFDGPTRSKIGAYWRGSFTSNGVGPVWGLF